MFAMSSTDALFQTVFNGATTKFAKQRSLEPGAAITLYAEAFAIVNKAAEAGVDLKTDPGRTEIRSTLHSHALLPDLSVA